MCDILPKQCVGLIYKIIEAFSITNITESRGAWVKKQKMGRSRNERDTNNCACYRSRRTRLNFSRFLSMSCNVWLCFWSQQEEFHPQLSHMVEFMLIKICSVYPNICTRVFIIEKNSIWIWALYRWQHDIVYVFLWLNILHKSADVNPSKFTRGIIITSGINFRY